MNKKIEGAKRKYTFKKLFEYFDKNDMTDEQVQNFFSGKTVKELELIALYGHALGFSKYANSISELASKTFSKMVSYIAYKLTRAKSTGAYDEYLRGCSLESLQSLRLGITLLNNKDPYFQDTVSLIIDEAIDRVKEIQDSEMPYVMKQAVNM